MELVSESGEQLAAGVEMNAYGDQAAVATNLFCCKSWEEPSTRYNWRSDEHYLIFRRDLTEYGDIVQ